MGTGLTNIKKVIFDTGSDYLALATQDCAKCKKKYDYSKSYAYL
jgi:hypothetical protein